MVVDLVFGQRVTAEENIALLQGTARYTFSFKQDKVVVSEAVLRGASHWIRNEKTSSRDLSSGPKSSDCLAAAEENFDMMDN